MSNTLSLHDALPISLLSGTTVKANLISTLPLVCTRPPHGLRLLIERWSNETEIHLQVAFEADSPVVLTDMAAQGVCYSILSPAAIQRDVEAGYLASATITHPAIERTACLCSSKRLPPDPAREAILALVREIAVDLVRKNTWAASATIAS